MVIYEEPMQLYQVYLQTLGRHSLAPLCIQYHPTLYKTFKYRCHFKVGLYPKLLDLPFKGPPQPLSWLQTTIFYLPQNLPSSSLSLSSSSSSFSLSSSSASSYSLTSLTAADHISPHKPKKTHHDRQNKTGFGNKTNHQDPQRHQQ